MARVIQVVEFANGMPCDHAGHYLASFDPDANGGRGCVTWAADLSKAMRFANVKDALEMWRRQSTVQPLPRRQTQSTPHRLHHRDHTAMTTNYYETIAQLMCETHELCVQEEQAKKEKCNEDR
jgi:hypothetical protein